MLEKFRTHIEEHKLCRKNEHILLAVSGGLDSMVMAVLFHSSGFKISVLHCNFCLRGNESDADEVLVRNFSNDHDIPFYSVKFNTESYASEHQLSIQLAARELRYRWFSEQLEKLGGDKLATAHHLNDQLETVLLNLTKGTGIKGIAGIPLKTGKIIRPLLFATREEILEYARENKIQWHEDASNASLKYQRNYIRHEVIPHLKHINSALTDTFLRTSKRLKEGSEIISATIKDFRERSLLKSGSDFVISIEVLKDKNPTFLHLLLEQFGINYQQAELLFEAVLNGSTGIVFPTDNHQINVDRTEIIISTLHFHFEPVEIFDHTATVPGIFTIEKFSSEKYSVIKDDNVAQLDFDKLKFPLLLRQWQHGDRFTPLGMKGQKKLSDFMIDNKIAVNLKKRILVLLSGDDVVWVVGQRIDERYKVTKSTKTIFKIQWLHEKSI